MDSTTKVFSIVSETLSKLRTPFALEILAELLVNEKDPLALFPIAENSIIVDKNIREAALTVLKRDNLPYRYCLFYDIWDYAFLEPSRY